MIKLSNAFRKFASRFTKKRIASTGVGLSFDEGFTTSTPITQKRIESAQRVAKAARRLKKTEEVGLFEVVGWSRKNDLTLYQLKHVLTGETFNVPKNVLELLFENVPPGVK